MAHAHLPAEEGAARLEDLKLDARAVAAKNCYGCAEAFANELDWLLCVGTYIFLFAVGIRTAPSLEAV